MAYTLDDPVEVNVTFLFVDEEGETIKVGDADGREVWLEIRHFHELNDMGALLNSDQGDELTISMPEWQAKRNGLI